MISRAKYDQDSVKVTLESLHNDYLEAIKGNATFLAEEGVRLYQGQYEDNEADIFNADSEICPKVVNYEELLAIKAAEKDDYRAIQVINVFR